MCVCRTHNQIFSKKKKLTIDLRSIILLKIKAFSGITVGYSHKPPSFPGCIEISCSIASEKIREIKNEICKQTAAAVAK